MWRAAHRRGWSGALVREIHLRVLRHIAGLSAPESPPRRRGSLQQVPQDPADLISDASLDAAVAALAERNRHHLEAMTTAERADAVAHWRELSLAVLTAATAAIGTEPTAGESEGPGRAVIVFEDAGGDDVNIHASFFPELEDLGDGEVAVTPAQAAALALLQEISGEPEEE